VHCTSSHCQKLRTRKAGRRRHADQSNTYMSPFQATQKLILLSLTVFNPVVFFHFLTDDQSYWYLTVCKSEKEAFWLLTYILIFIVRALSIGKTLPPDICFSKNFEQAGHSLHHQFYHLDNCYTMDQSGDCLTIVWLLI